MNKRIEQLIAQVGGIGHDDDGNELTPALVGKSLESFAELIVQECIREIGYKSVELLDIDFYPHYQERLKKYFGVEK